MSRIFWDTNLFIYLVEKHEMWGPLVRKLAARMWERNDSLFTSALTLGETLVHPIARGNVGLQKEYEEAILMGGEVISFDSETAIHYARIRKDRSIDPPDAIQLACAARAQIDLFITNDDDLSQKIVPGIGFITSLERAPL